MEAGITKVVTAAYISSDENNARFIAVEAGITKSYYYCKVSRVENDAGFNAMEEGITNHCNRSWMITAIEVG